MSSSEDFGPRPLREEDILEAISRVSELTGHRSFVLIGNGTLAVEPKAPDYAKTTEDVDLYPLGDNPQKIRDLINDKLGATSSFASEHRFYVQPVDSWTTVHLPEGWFERTTLLETACGIKAHCLSPVDLCLCKLHAGRAKDIPHVANLLDTGLVTEQSIRDLIEQVRERQPALADRQIKNLERVLTFHNEHSEPEPAVETKGPLAQILASLVSYSPPSHSKEPPHQSL